MLGTETEGVAVPSRLQTSLRELGTEQVRQVLRTAHAVHNYSSMTAALAKFFCTRFWDRNCPATMLNGQCF